MNVSRKKKITVIGGGTGVLQYALVNTSIPSQSRLKRYGEERSQMVELDFLKPFSLRTITGDFLRNRGFLRHDPEKLARALFKLI